MPYYMPVGLIDGHLVCYYMMYCAGPRASKPCWLSTLNYRVCSICLSFLCIVYNTKLQQTPSPRVVFCTDEQLDEIVKECCSAKSQSILAIDTTYNVGDFYVTSTSYQSSKFIHSRTGKLAVLPGPAMLHVRRSGKDLKYLIYTLLEQNDQLECIAILGGDRDKAQRGFLMPLKRCTFLPCKKHVAHDIARKLVELEMKDEKEQILTGIFGCEKTRQKGLIDSSSADEYLAKVLSVKYI